jgi:hypothetical protein
MIPLAEEVDGAKQSLDEPYFPPSFADRW